MKLVSFTVFLLTLCCPTFSQYLEWAYQVSGTQTDIGGGLVIKSDYSFDLLSDEDGGVVVYGAVSGIGDLDFYPSEHVLGSEDVMWSYLSGYNADAELLWTTPCIFSDGSAHFFRTEVASDPTGNLFVGTTLDLPQDVDPGIGENFLTPSDLDGLLIKYNADGEYQWAVQFGSEEADYIFSTAVDPEGNVLVAGMISGLTDFDPGPGEAWEDVGETDGLAPFVAKYDTDGNYLWSSVLKKVSGSPAFTYANANKLSVDSQGSIYLGGAFWGALDTDPGPNVAPLVNNGLASNFLLVKLDADGEYIWSFTVEGSDEIDEVRNLLIDSEDNVYVFGTLSSSNADFDPGPDEYLLSPESADAAFLAKYRPDASFEWGFLLETNGWLWPSVATFDENQNIVFAFSALFALDLDPGPAETIVSADERNATMIRYDQEGNYLSNMMIEGTGDNYLHDITFCPDATYYLGGGFSKSADFDPGAGACFLHINMDPINQDNSFDAFLAKYTPDCTPADPFEIPIESLQLCEPESIQIDIPADTELNNACCWYLYQGSCGSVPIDSTRFGPFFINPTESGWWYIGAGGDCTSEVACDSIYIEVYEDIPTQLPDLIICSGDSTLIFGEYQSEPGIYEEVFVNDIGCDSTVQQVLLLDTLLIELQQSGDSLAVISTPIGNYQWINCDTGEPVPGATDALFVPEISGNYAVEVTSFVCQEVSDCQTVEVTVSTEDFSRAKMQVFPNPTTGNIWLAFAERQNLQKWELYDMQGRLVQSAAFAESEIAGNRLLVDLSEAPAGMYLLKVQGQKGAFLCKVICF
ncbi:MAG: T9SS type A sorting domain-containing protein [Bacteroidetes bacterium]|nr:T9SS type A sorting domain-containing protein [Bacteroidota bacterium]